MRSDIAKDEVLAHGKAAAGKQNDVIGYLDPEPVQNLLQETLK